MTEWESSVRSSIEVIRARDASVRRCTEPELRSVERSVGRSLPRAYRLFLEGVGGNTGDFMVGSDFDLKYVKRVIRYRYAEFMEREGMAPLNDDMFVFLGHQDYQFFWFRLSEGDDPEVLHYLEGRREHVSVAPSFSAFLERLVRQEYGDGPRRVVSDE